MPQITIIALIVVLVAVRLALPPVPRLIKEGFARWGAWNTIILCSISVACAVLAIVALRR